mgnify:CR=1 FL=1
MRKEFYTGHLFDVYRYFGAHKEGENFIFRVFAPSAKGVCVFGEFSNWTEIPMYQEGQSGVYVSEPIPAKTGQMYKYCIYTANGGRVEHCDPYGFQMELRPGDCSILTDLYSYKFKDEKWMKNRTVGFDSPVNIYEIHAGSWRKKGEGKTDWYTYIELAKLLIPYVKKNHYTHIEMMPLSEHPFDGSWGYQNTGFFAPTARYGTPDELKKFVDECHQAGIGVIMDFVPVHFAVDYYGLKEFDGTCLYEYPNAAVGESEWGSCNFMHSRGEVRCFLQSAANYWLSEFHFDGIRMDAVSRLIYWQGDEARGVNGTTLDFLKVMNQGLKSLHPTAMLIAEDSTNFPGVTKPVDQGGLGFDYKWDLGFMHDTLEYFQSAPEYRSRDYHKLTFSMMYYYNEHFLLEYCHDEVVHGKATILQKMWGENDLKFQQAKTLYTYMYTHPGKKLNFMGNEIGQFREWDEEKECDWMLLDYPKHQDFHRFMKDLNHLYISEPAFFNGDYNSANFRWIEVEAVEERVYIYERMCGENHFIVVLNMSDAQYNDFEFGYDHYAVLHEVLSGERKEYGGYFEGPKEDIVAKTTGYKWWKRKFKITIPALAAIIYKVEFLPEPKEIPLPMLDEASIDIDRKRLRAEHEN